MREGNPEPFYEKVITDVEHDIYIEELTLTNDELNIEEEWVIRKRRLKGGLSDGVDIITVNNGSLSFTIIPTRGMSIWRGYFGDIRLGWDSPIKNPVHPRHINLESRGFLGWLDGFNEWIVRCGLESFGAPGTDIIIDNMGRKKEITLPLHGKIANIPAEVVKVKVTRKPQVELIVEGILFERSMFGPNLKLVTEIVTFPKSNSIIIRDTVENLKPLPQEMQLLYHCNYGKPVLNKGARIIAPFLKVMPRDEIAAKDIETFDIYGPPKAGFVEQVYFCELACDDHAYTTVALINKDENLATSITYSVRELPYFTIWKNTASEGEGYVTGLEPATSYPNPRRVERENGRIVKLGPKESFKTQLKFAVHVEKDEIKEIKERIEELKVKPIIYKKPL